MPKKYNPEQFLPAAIRVAELEELVLLAIAGLEENAYGISIQRRLQEAGRPVSTGALYAALQRLQNKCAIAISQRSDPTGHRGGRSKIYYELTRAGQGALDESEQVRSRLRADSNEVTAPKEIIAPLLISSPHEKKSPINVKPVAVPVKPTAPSGEEKHPPPPPPRPDYILVSGPRW